mgnify:CR=1 FL=1
MTLPRLEAMGEYWYNHPPVHLMLRQFFGLGEKSQAPSDGESGDLDELVGMFAAGWPGMVIKDTSTDG